MTIFCEILATALNYLFSSVTMYRPSRSWLSWCASGVSIRSRPRSRRCCSCSVCARSTTVSSSSSTRQPSTCLGFAVSFRTSNSIYFFTFEVRSSLETRESRPNTLLELELYSIGVWENFKYSKQLRSATCVAGIVSCLWPSLERSRQSRRKGVLGGKELDRVRIWLSYRLSFGLSAWW